MFVRNCNVFQTIKPELVPYPGLLQPLPIPNQIWYEISMDFVDSLPMSKGKIVIMVVVDRISKMGHFIPLSHPYTAITVSQSFLDNIYKLNGLTKLIVSDKDTFFLSRFWKELFQVSLHTSSTYNPQTDRQTEYNTSYHTGINNTPLQVVYGQPPPAHITYNHGESPLETMDRSLAAREAVIDLLKKHTLRKNKQHKLSQKYYGPFRILAKVGKVAYKLELPDNAQIHPVFHVLQLKAHRGETPLSPRNLPHCNNEGLIAVEPYAILDRRMAKKAMLLQFMF
ncbi:retrotransposable element Tf2 [Tanacetum coccineum]